jgi:serine phosphatase RsbU (regulator of sigma subunit)
MAKTYEELKQENKKLKGQVISSLRELTQRNEQLMAHQKDLDDSITYAERIQTAIMPPKNYIDRVLPENFILYLPRDVVSGDFYFVEELNDEVVFAAVDCTGHGIPGALISMIGFNYLHLAVADKGITQPSKILQYLDVGVNERLRQTANESGVKDGMELGLCTLNRKTNVLQYAGAYNPMYIISDNEISIIKPDKLEIGVNPDGVADDYTNHTLQLKKGDSVYLLSDGFPDQFGGPKGKKFMYKQLRDVLVELNDLTMPEQKKRLLTIFHNWKGSEEQVDDVLIMGVRVE